MAGSLVATKDAGVMQLVVRRRRPKGKRALFKRACEPRASNHWDMQCCDPATTKGSGESRAAAMSTHGSGGSGPVAGALQCGAGGGGEQWVLFQVSNHLPSPIGGTS